MKERFLALFLIVMLNSMNIQAQNSVAEYLHNRNEFAFLLFSNFANNRKNICISPFYINQAFSVLYNGAKGGTAKQMSFALKLHPEYRKNFVLSQEADSILQAENDPYNYSYHSALFISADYPPQPVFVRYASKYNGFNFYTVDFKNHNVNDTIGIWLKSVEESDNDFRYCCDYPDTSVMVLASQTKYKGLMAGTLIKKPFIIDDAGHKTRAISFIRVTGYFDYVEADNYQIIRLPYKNNQLSLIIILPKEIKKLSYIKSDLLNNDNFDFWLSSLTQVQGEVSIPVFNSEYYGSMKDIFLKYIPVSFILGANFLRLYPNYLYLTDVLHACNFSTTIDKNALANAVSDVEISDEFRQKITIDRPFVFMVVDNMYNAVIYIGQYIRPPRR